MFQSEVFHIQNDFQVQTHKLIAFNYIYLILFDCLWSHPDRK